MKEYRTCMPLTVEEVSLFAFPTLLHTLTQWGPVAENLKTKESFF